MSRHYYDQPGQIDAAPLCAELRVRADLRRHLHDAEGALFVDEQRSRLPERRARAARPRPDAAGAAHLAHAGRGRRLGRPPVTRRRASRPIAMIDASARPPLAMTMGDPAGDRPRAGACAPGSPATPLARRSSSSPTRRRSPALARRLGLAAPIVEVAPGEAARRLRARAAGRPARRPRRRAAGRAERRLRRRDDRVDRTRRRCGEVAARRAPSSPIRSPRRRSTPPASSFPATPNSSARSPSAIGAARRSR